MYHVQIHMRTSRLQDHAAAAPPTLQTLPIVIKDAEFRDLMRKQTRLRTDAEQEAFSKLEKSTIDELCGGGAKKRAGASAKPKSGPAVVGSKSAPAGSGRKRPREEGSSAGGRGGAAAEEPVGAFGDLKHRRQDVQGAPPSVGSASSSGEEDQDNVMAILVNQKKLLTDKNKKKDKVRFYSGEEDQDNVMAILVNQKKLLTDKNKKKDKVRFFRTNSVCISVRDTVVYMQKVPLRQSYIIRESFPHFLCPLSTDPARLRRGGPGQHHDHSGQPEEAPHR